jgi:hypothetical protein
MARARIAKHPEPVQTPQHEEPSSPARAPQASVSKADAIRAALAEGLDSLGDIEGFIKSRFGLEMPRQMISSYKAQQKARDKKQAGGEEPARKPRGPVAKPTLNGELDVITALEALKPLVHQLGAEKVKRLVDVLG